MLLFVVVLILEILNKFNQLIDFATDFALDQMMGAGNDRMQAGTGVAAKYSTERMTCDMLRRSRVDSDCDSLTPQTIVLPTNKCGWIGQASKSSINVGRTINKEAAKSTNRQTQIKRIEKVCPVVLLLFRLCHLF